MPHAHPSGFPPRLQHGEGQALALREEEAFFSAYRGACPRDTRKMENYR